jgi:hypothetical protein
MDELREALGGLLPHPLGGAVRGDQVGVLRLELAQLALEPVVLLVADLRLVKDVVQPLVAPDLLAQRLDARGGLGAASRGGRALNGRGPG